MNFMSRSIFIAVLSFIVVGLVAARAQGNPPANASATLFQNVRIFDAEALHSPHRPMC